MIHEAITPKPTPWPCLPPAVFRLGSLRSRLGPYREADSKCHQLTDEYWNTQFNCRTNDRAAGNIQNLLIRFLFTYTCCSQLNSGAFVSYYLQICSSFCVCHFHPLHKTSILVQYPLIGRPPITPMRLKPEKSRFAMFPPQPLY